MGISDQFSSSGSTTINNTGEIFIDQVPTMLNLLSAGDELISNLIINRPISSFEPSFFQLPYLCSIIYNVNINNYTSTSSTNGDLITSIYTIPYTDLLEERKVTFITFYDTVKKILNYEIPRELSYNSIEQANVYFDVNNYNFNLIIPSSFYYLNSKLNYYLMKFNINNLNKNLILSFSGPLKTNYIAIGYRLNCFCGKNMDPCPCPDN
jgi:hypothetical protein